MPMKIPGYERQVGLQPLPNTRIEQRNTNTSPEAYGAEVSRAWGGVAGAINQAGEVYQKQMEDKMAVDLWAAQSEFQSKVQDLISNPQSGILVTKVGKDAENANGIFSEEVRKIRDEVKKKLPQYEKVHFAFDQFTEEKTLKGLDMVQRHQIQELDNYTLGTATNSAQTIIDGAAKDFKNLTALADAKNELKLLADTTLAPRFGKEVAEKNYRSWINSLVGTSLDTAFSHGDNPSTKAILDIYESDEVVDPGTTNRFRAVLVQKETQEMVNTTAQEIYKKYGSDLAGAIVEIRKLTEIRGAAPNAPATNPAGQQAKQQILGIVKDAANKNVAYTWGGEDLNSGVDCSGLIVSAFGKAGINLGKTRTTSDFPKDPNFVKIKDRKDIQPGDLILFDSGGHIGIALDKDTNVEANGGRKDHGSRGNGKGVRLHNNLQNRKIVGILRHKDFVEGEHAKSIAQPLTVKLDSEMQEKITQGYLQLVEQNEAAQRMERENYQRAGLSQLFNLYQGGVTDFAKYKAVVDTYGKHDAQTYKFLFDNAQSIASYFKKPAQEVVRMPWDAKVAFIRALKTGIPMSYDEYMGKVGIYTNDPKEKLEMANKYWAVLDDKNKSVTKEAEDMFIRRNGINPKTAKGYADILGAHDYVEQMQAKFMKDNNSQYPTAAQIYDWMTDSLVQAGHKPISKGIMNIFGGGQKISFTKGDLYRLGLTNAVYGPGGDVVEVTPINGKKYKLKANQFEKMLGKGN